MFRFLWTHQPGSTEHVQCSTYLWYCPTDVRAITKCCLSPQVMDISVGTDVVRFEIILYKDSPNLPNVSITFFYCTQSLGNDFRSILVALCLCSVLVMASSGKYCLPVE